MLLRAAFLILAVCLGLLSIGGISYGLNPASAHDSVAPYFVMLVITVSLTILFAWLAFRRAPARQSPAQTAAPEADR